MTAVKVRLVDYVGQSDEKGNPVGHPVKTLIEVGEMLKPYFDVDFQVPVNYSSHIPGEDLLLLKYFTPVSPLGLKGKILPLLGKIVNLYRVFKKSGDHITWFVNSDFLLYVFIYFYPFSLPKKAVLTLYMEGFGRTPGWKGRVKQFFFLRSIKKIDLVLKNSEKLKVTSNELFFPDYFYNPEQYRSMGSQKEETLLAVGLMSRAKEIVKLAEVCSAAGIALKIHGFFPDKTMLQEIKEYTGNHVRVTDGYLSDEEYYRNISTSAFCVLPYKKSSYDRRTSGILLECIFMGTIVIAPGFLLDYTDLPGVGYERLEELPGLLAGLSPPARRELGERMARIRENYDQKKVKERVVHALQNLIRPRQLGDKN